MTRAQSGVLALDLGTSSVRAVVYDQRGRLVEPAFAEVPYQLDTSTPGQASSDADQLVDLIEGAIDTAVKAARKEGLSIAAVAASCYWHSLMGVDRAGRPTTELLTWADTRSQPAAAALRASSDEHAYHRRTGCFFHASFWPAKLRWLKAARPAAFRETVRWVSLAEYLYGRFFPEAQVSISIASGTGLLDVHRCRWDAQALRLAGISSTALSSIADWDAPATGLRPAYARRWPRLADLPWYLPVGDGALSNVGAGCLKPEWLCAMIGTSSALRVVLETPDVEVPWGAFAYRLDRRRFVLGGALSEGGNVIRWLHKLLGFKKRTEAEAAVRTIPADSHGLTVLPFWAGERSPNWRGDVRGVISGLSLSTRPEEVVRAAMEGISLQIGQVYGAMRETTRRPRRVIATGGQLLHSNTWMQMLADVLDVPVSASAEPEASSRGAALLALYALGRRPTLWRDHPRVGRTFHPRPTAQRAYAAAMKRQAELYQRVFDRLSRAEPQRRGTIKSQKAGSSKPSRQTLTPRN
jgi:gluconokinase